MNSGLPLRAAGNAAQGGVTVNLDRLGAFESRPHASYVYFACEFTQRGTLCFRCFLHVYCFKPSLQPQAQPTVRRLHTNHTGGVSTAPETRCGHDIGGLSEYGAQRLARHLSECMATNVLQRVAGHIGRTDLRKEIGRKMIRISDHT